MTYKYQFYGGKALIAVVFLDVIHRNEHLKVNSRGLAKTGCPVQIHSLWILGVMGP